MKAIVVGCGRFGAELTDRLYKRGHQVSVIASTETDFDNLSADFRGHAIVGDPLNREILHSAGIQQASALALVTNNDPLNAVVAHIGRSVYQVPNIIVRNYNPRWRPLHEAFGLQMISSTIWGAQRIEEMMYAVNVRSLLAAGNGEVEVYEFIIPDTWDNKPLQDLLCKGCMPVSVVRAGRATLPESHIQLQKGDVVQVSATLDGIETLRQRLKEDK